MGLIPPLVESVDQGTLEAATSYAGTLITQNTTLYSCTVAQPVQQPISRRESAAHTEQGVHGRLCTVSYDHEKLLLWHCVWMIVSENNRKDYINRAGLRPPKVVRNDPRWWRIIALLSVRPDHNHANQIQKVLYTSLSNCA